MGRCYTCTGHGRDRCTCADERASDQVAALTVHADELAALLEQGLQISRHGTAPTATGAAVTEAGWQQQAADTLARHRAAHGRPNRHSRDEVADALNRACEDIIDAAQLPDEGVRDALNLLVNAAVSYLTDEAGTLGDVAASCYDEPLDEVLGWISQT